ncbi:hypothetical protein ACFY1P_24310 [Streptomyces sp. NPDC001407]|uniref:hypothetical protein n=1 Tax=Streptomyces sp. NPDC001407 TaxID=3364573 RepID=UPI003683D061
MDVTGRAALTPAVREAEDAYGPTDVLVNSARVMLTGDPVTQSPDGWDRMTAGVRAAYRAQEAAPEGGLIAEDVAEAIRYACRRPRNVRIREIAPADTGRTV